MSLAPHEQRVLARIESSLHDTDPALAAMLATFTVPRQPKIRRHRLPWRLWRRTNACVTAVLVAIATAALVLSVLLAAPGHQQQCPPRGQQSLPFASLAACAPAHAGRPPGSHPPGK